jgi:plasmid stabilization system protein ParE
LKVRFLRPAQDEYLEALRYYTGQATDLGVSFLADLDHASQLLAELPSAGAPYDGETRRLLLRRFPYSLIYLIEAEVLVIAVRHHRQQPVSWRERTGRRS